jgi:predicted NBD/HSP70 family sugar kinase
MQPTGVRQSNLRAVLTVVSMSPGLSNADVARRTGLAPQTVSSVLLALEKSGLLSRGEVRRSGARGQPATPYFINPEGAFAIGAEIGWRHFEIALVDVETRVITRERTPHDYPDAATIVAQLAAGVARLEALIPADLRHRLIGLGLAVPSGLGDPAAMEGLPVRQQALWAELDLAAAAAAATGLDVAVVNDGNAACWAELVARPSPRPGNFVYLLVDTALAGGVASDGRLWQGASTNLGAMLVSDGQGAARFVRDVASLGALAARLAAARLSLKTAFSPEPPARAAALLAEWIEDAGFALARTILNTAAVLACDLAIIDGDLPGAVLDRLLAATERHLNNVAGLGRPPPTVARGQLGRSGAAQGAAFVQIYRRFFSRELADMPA